MHISFNGLQESAFKDVSFPYVALCPSNRRKSEFRDITDVYEEIIRLYDEAEDKGFNVGEACYKQIPYFANYSSIINNIDQTTILKYSYSKSTNTPPYPSLQDTPADFVDQFMIIEQETSLINKSEQENASK